MTSGRKRRREEEKASDLFFQISGSGPEEKGKGGSRRRGEKVFFTAENGARKEKGKEMAQEGEEKDAETRTVQSEQNFKQHTPFPKFVR